MIDFKLTPAGASYTLFAVVGYIPGFLDSNDMRPAVEQIDERYVAGWNDFEGFNLVNGEGLQYPEDPVLPPLAVGYLREERICVYESGWVAIIQPTGEYKVARLD